MWLRRAQGCKPVEPGRSELLSLADFLIMAMLGCDELPVSKEGLLSPRGRVVIYVLKLLLHEMLGGAIIRN